MAKMGLAVAVAATAFLGSPVASDAAGPNGGHPKMTMRVSGCEFTVKGTVDMALYPSATAISLRLRKGATDIATWSFNGTEIENSGGPERFSHTFVKSSGSSATWYGGMLVVGPTGIMDQGYSDGVVASCT
jgi:hypothetical protein